MRRARERENWRRGASDYFGLARCGTEVSRIRGLCPGTSVVVIAGHIHRSQGVLSEKGAFPVVGISTRSRVGSPSSCLTKLAPLASKDSKCPVRTKSKLTRPFVAGEPGCRRQALVSWVLFEGALVASVTRWPLRGRGKFLIQLGRKPNRQSQNKSNTQSSNLGTTGQTTGMGTTTTGT